MYKIALIIINYNRSEDTYECLKSLDIYTSKSKNLYEVYLLDNGQDDCMDPSILSNYYHDIHYFKSEYNLGFAEGNNFLIKKTMESGCYDYYALINNDTVIVDMSMDKLINQMKEKNVGIGGLINYYFTNPETIWQAGAYFDKKRKRFIIYDDFDPNGNRFVQVDYVPGSSMFIKREVIETIGMLDTKYFAYYEESDYCFRAKKVGYKVAFLEGTKILHKVGMSSSSYIREYLRTRNRLYFCSKNISKKDTLKILVWAFYEYSKRVAKGSFGLYIYMVLIIAYNDYRKGLMYQGSMSKIKRK